MNEIIIMTIPDTEKPYYLYDKTLKRAVNKDSYATYEEAEKELQKYLKMGYYTKEKAPSKRDDFKKMFNNFKKRYVKPDDNETGGKKRF